MHHLKIVDVIIPFTNYLHKWNLYYAKRSSWKGLIFYFKITFKGFVKRLKGFNLYALRVGDYRVIMSIENKLLVIFVLDVVHGSVIYRKY